MLQETVHHECLERDELLEKLEETRNELLELKKNACLYFYTFFLVNLFTKKICFKDTSQQIIPIKASLNKSNINSFKNGTGLIDVSNGPSKITGSSFPRNLNEINNSNNKSSSSSSQGSGRRNSVTGLSQRTPSDKSSAESSAKVVESGSNRKANLSNRAALGAAASLSNNKLPTEPIELFKRINEISRNASNKPTSKPNPLAENKKRINLLLTRKN